METGYVVLQATGNLKNDDDQVRYYVEPSDGGGIEFTGNSLKEAEDYIKSVGGHLDEVM